MNLASRHWLSAILLTVLALLPSSASAGMTPEEVKAFEGVKAKAEKGDVDAQFNLGVCYATGAGVMKDQAQAVSWYRKVAGEEWQYARAQFNLGNCYFNGEGVAKDQAQAVSWYRKAAEQGLANAQANLGLCYARGLGVSKDVDEAVKWHRKAATQGLANAQYNLGVSYNEGEGVAKDYVQAVSWYRKAAEQGYAKAQYNLGVCYDIGEGVPKNKIEAYAYWSLAKITDESARKNLASLEKEMSPDERLLGQQRATELQKVIEANKAGEVKLTATQPYSQYTTQMDNSVPVHFAIAIGFAIWTIIDSRKRGKLAWGYAIGSALLLWWIVLPFYFAGRKLLPGETREGGYGWNACKFFLLFWSLLLGYCLALGMVNVSEHLEGRQMSAASEAGAAIGVGLGLGMYFCLWVGVAIPTLVIGLLLKKSSVVEKGDDASAPIAPPVAPNPPAPDAPLAPAPVQGIQFSVARQGKTIGTFDGLTFRKMIASGEILLTDHYWKQGMAGWDLVDNYRG